MRLSSAEYQRRHRAKNRRLVQPDLSTTPATLTLEQYEAVAPDVVRALVDEFGRAGALRVLNGKPDSTPPVAPADPATIAPPGDGAGSGECP